MTELQWLQNAQSVDNARGDTLSEICEEIGIDTTGVGIDRAVQSQEAEQVDDVVAKVDAAWDSLDTAVGRAVDLDRNTIAAFRVAGVSGKRFLGQATITSITMDDTLTFDTEQGESFSGDITEFYFE
jgi:hypothetical protein